MTDQRALHQYAAYKDADAFRLLVEQYQRMVYSAAARRLAHSHDIEDTVQLTFLKLAKAAGSIRRDLAAWLYATALNTANDLVRRDQTRQRHEALAAVPESVTDDHDKQEWQRLSLLIDEAILELPVPQQSLLIEHFFREGGHSQRDLAAVMNVSQSTVQRRINAAVEDLRVILKRRGCIAATAPLAMSLTELGHAEVPTSLTVQLTKIGLAGTGTPLVVSLFSRYWMLMAAAACVALLATMGTLLLRPSTVAPASMVGPTAPPDTVAISVPAQPRTFSLQELKDGIHSRSKRYNVGHYEFTVTTYNLLPSDPVSVEDWVLYRSGERNQIRRDSKTVGTKLGIDRGAWDGELCTGYGEHPNLEPDLRFSGTIRSRPAIIMYERWIISAREELTETKRSMASVLDIGEWEPLGKKNIGPYPAWGLKSKGPVGDLGARIELWVSPANDFAPVSLTETLPEVNHASISNELCDVELGKFDDRWIIVKSKLAIHNPFTQMDQFVAYDLRAFAPQIPEMDFRLKFPLGTHVFDDVNKIGFMAGKYVEVRDVNGVVTPTDISLFPQYVALTDYSTGLTDAEYQTTKWASIVVQGSLETPKAHNVPDFPEAVKTLAVAEPNASVRSPAASYRIWPLVVAGFVAGVLATIGLLYNRYHKRRA